MGHAEVERANPDWEQAFDRFQSVMASGSEAVCLQVITKLASLSKRAPEHVLARSVPFLARLLGDDPSNHSTPIQEAAAYCLYRMTCQGEGRMAIEIGQSVVVLSILRLLPRSDNGFHRILVKCLWGLVTFATGNRVNVARNGGLEIIVDMLKSCTDDTRRYLLEILSALASLREVRRVIVSLDGLCFLVEAASCGSMVSRERACHAIGLLGVTRRARRMLFELGVIPVLVELFHNGDTKTKLIAGNSLGVVSAHIDFIRPVAAAGAIPLYVELLQGPDPLGKDIAEDAFCILAVAESNAVVIVEHLVRILRNGDDDEAKAAAADVLWDLSGYTHSVSVVQNSGAIPILFDLLSNSNVEVKEKVSGAIAQLSYDESDRLALASAGVIPVLIELLHDESEELKDHAAEALINFSEDPMQRDRISEAIDNPTFQDMQNRMVHVRASDEHTVRSLRRMSIQQLSWNMDLV